MNRAFLFFAILVFIICSAGAYAGTGRTVAQFLAIDGGTRAAGMGDSFAAVSGDVISAFWNPSGLASLSDRQVTIAYTNYAAMFGEASEGMYYGLMGFAAPIKDLGVFGTTFQLQDQGTTLLTKDSPEAISEIDLGTNWAWALCYADKITDNFNAGINLKLIRQVLWTESDIAYAIDAGIQYAIPGVPLNLGVALRNLGTGIQMKDEYQSQPLPRDLKFGLAIKVFETPSHRFQVVSDFTSFIDKMSKTEEDKQNPKFDAKSAGVGIHAFRPENSQKGFGAEYWYANSLGIRVGYKNVPDTPGRHITMGFSVRYANYQIDYARVPGTDVPGGGDIDKFAIMIRF